LAELIYAERESRQEMLRSIVTSPARIESAPYDEVAGPEGYMAEIRRAMQYMPLPGKITGPMQAEKNFVAQLAAEYLAAQPKWLKSIEPAEQSDAVFSFTETLLAFAITPRAHATESYNTERLITVKNRFPAIATEGLTVMMKSAKKLPITREDLDALKTAIDAIDPALSLAPDFFQLDKEKQSAIIAAIGQEWQSMTEIFLQHAPTLLGSKKRYTHAPLAYLSYADLMQAFDNYPTIPPAEVCRIFWQESGTFEKLLKREADYRQKRANEDRALQALREAKAAQKLPGQPEVEYLLAQEVVNPAIVDLMPGHTLELGPQGEILTIKQFQRIIDLNLELFGRAMHQRRFSDQQRPRALDLDCWKSDDAANRLRDGFNGRLSNLSVTYVPVTEEQLMGLVKDYDPKIHTPETVAQLMLGVDMRSGKGAYRGILTLQLILRSYKNADALAKSFYKSVSSGSIISRGLRAQSAAIAGIITAHNAATPITSGFTGRGTE
jgi:hypothetical protein